MKNNQLTLKRPAAFTVASLGMAGAVSFMGGLVYGVICPAVQPGATSAESTVSGGTSTTVSADSVISITAPTAVNIDITPEFGTNTFASAAATVSVSTNNAYGYSLTMGTSGTDGNGAATAALIHKTAKANTVAALSADTTLSTFSSASDTTTTNKWGYTTDNNGSDTDLGQITSGTYKPMTTTSAATLIKKTDAAATTDSTVVTFAAKADSSLPSGDYSNTVVFTATANPHEVNTLDDANTMQELSDTTACADTEDYATTGTTYTLTDARDNKSYAVRKLADGNCWMVQNLALDINTGTLSSDTSDVESGSTFTMPTTSTTNFTEGSNPQYSGDNNNEMHTGTHTDGHVASVDSGSLYSSDLTDTGNWYSWYTATAGTGTNTMSSGNATSSICPKGWTLPTGGSSGEFYALYTAYSSSQANLNAVFPLQLSGLYASGGLYGSGSWGGWWSSTAYSTQSAYGLLADASGINPAGTSTKYYGRSVRCVSAG